MAPTLFENKAKPGDLIQISRGWYEHWAVYIGENEVVHLVTPDFSVSGASGSVLSLASDRGKVRRQKIWDVVGEDQFCINNLLDDKYEPRERHVIVRDACRMVGRVLPYSVTSRNCEHFATQLRYGRAESRQVKAAVTTAVGATVGLVALVAGAALIRSLLKHDDDDEDDEES